MLSLNELSIDEFDLLAPVSKWVDCEVQRQGLPLNQENRRKVFEPIKGYVLFSSLKPEKVANCEEIAELLTVEEIGSLVLHLNLGKPLMIEQKTSRSVGAKPFSVFAVLVFSSTLFASGYSGTRVVNLSVNRRVRIRAIHLTYSKNAPYQSFQVQKSGVNLDMKANCSVKDGKLRLSFTPSFDVEPSQSYRLDVTCSESLKPDDQLTKQQSLSYGSTTFSLRLLSDYSFVRGLEFVPLD